MEKRIFTLILVVIIGVLAGVGIVSKQGRDSVMTDVSKQLNALIESQKKLESRFSGGSTGGDFGLAQKQSALEAKVAALEAKVTKLEGIVGQGGNNPPQMPPPEDLSKVYDIPVSHSYVRGNKNAPVTIVEFVDFQCPFCARFHSPLNETLKMYPDKVNYVLKNFPLSFHPQAKPAAKAALAAGEQGKYWEMADKILDNGNSLSPDKLQEIAQGLGLDMKKFNADLKNKDQQWEDYIQKDIALGSQVDVRGTPTFYLNGKKTNARDANSFKTQIDAILNQ